MSVWCVLTYLALKCAFMLDISIQIVLWRTVCRAPGRLKVVHYKLISNLKADATVHACVASETAGSVREEAEPGHCNLELWRH
jgi:hypothetical protein